MKKLLIALLITITASLGCKQEEIGGGELCDCPAVTAPSLNLVIRDAAGEDLLYSKSKGYFSPSQIKLYVTETSGNVKNIEFTIRPPFTYGGNQFRFYQLSSPQIVSFVSSTSGIFYIKLGDNAPHKLTLKINGSTGRVDRLLINDNEAAVETDADKNISNGSIFYLDL